MAQALKPDLLTESPPATIATTISDRLSEELVVALVGPVGSGVSTAATFVLDILTTEFGYDVAPIIVLSSIIGAEAHRVGIAPPPRAQLGKYIAAMQTAGNKLREQFGPNYLAEKAIEKIVTFRTAKEGYTKVADGRSVQLPGRRAYIIDSIKNIEELELLRQIYGDTLCLVGIFAPDEMRRVRLVDSGAITAEVKSIVDRDQGEDLTWGQMTRKVFTQADFYICNDQKKDELRKGVERYLHIIFDTKIHTPTKEESAMYKANAVASNSACMSRQVGAAIVSKEGELIAVGWNDVPKFGGSLYSEDDQSVWDKTEEKLKDKDHRCFNWDKKICHNEIRREGILNEITERLVESGLLKKKGDAADIRNLLAGTAVDALIEYSRAIHAEMEAILSVAREGKHSLVNATLYTTVYPCHHCARHIVAAGISAVVYIQPYAKSLATALHNDAITESRTEPGKVLFRQYNGVAPRNFLRLFQPKGTRKKDGKLSRPNAKGAPPLFRIPLDGTIDYEAKVVADLSAKEQTAPT